MAKQPLCISGSIDKGPCPNFALNGTLFCLQHAEIARDACGDPVDTGYRPGGIGATEPAPDVDQAALTAAVRAVDEQLSPAPRSTTADWAGPPPPVRRRGWFAGLAAVFR